MVSKLKGVWRMAVGGNLKDGKRVIPNRVLALSLFIAMLSFGFPAKANAITIDITTGTYPFTFDGNNFGTGGSVADIVGGVVTSTGISTSGSITFNTAITGFDANAGDGIAFATFGTSSVSTPDFQLFDGLAGTGNKLIEGNFIALTAFGMEGSGAGGAVASLSLSGTVNIIGGTIFDAGPGTSMTATFSITSPDTGLPTDVFVDQGSGAGKVFSGIASSTFQGESASVPVPEPTTLLLLGSGLLALGLVRRSKKV